VEIAVAASAIAAEQVRRIARPWKVLGLSRGGEKSGTGVERRVLEEHLPPVEEDPLSLGPNLNLLQIIISSISSLLSRNGEFNREKE
jgi:hypothetical protein